MTIEGKNLESDFYYVKEDCKEEKDKAGEELRAFGRRFVDLIDEYIPQKMTSPRWKSIADSLKQPNVQTKTLIDHPNENQQSVTIKIHAI